MHALAHPFCSGDLETTKGKNIKITHLMANQNNPHDAVLWVWWRLFWAGCGTKPFGFCCGWQSAVKKRAGRTKDGWAYNPSNLPEKDFAKIANQQLHKFGYGNFTFGNPSSLEISIKLNFAVCGRNDKERQRSLWAKGGQSWQFFKIYSRRTSRYHLQEQQAIG